VEDIWIWISRETADTTGHAPTTPRPALSHETPDPPSRSRRCCNYSFQFEFGLLADHMIVPPINQHLQPLPLAPLLHPRAPLIRHLILPPTLPRPTWRPPSLASLSPPKVRLPRPRFPKLHLNQFRRRITRYLRPWQKNKEGGFLLCVSGDQRSMEYA
jgi:hypothetical protein